jgi:hypothetical protein
MKSLRATALFRRVAVAAALAGAGAMAQAEPFSCITGTANDCSLATSTLSWNWNGLDFTVSNAAGGGYVSEVYFDLLAGMSAWFFGGSGGPVNFYSLSVNPSSLPGGNSVGFHSDAAFDSDFFGNPHWGIDAGESATFRIIGASLDSFTAGNLGAGMHVRSLINDSASVVTTTANKVPEPSSFAMALLGLGMLAWGLRRKPR